MELRHLRYFVGVAGEKSFTRAAAKLRVAQPALSRQIRQLEEETGVTLLIRGRKGVELTEAGRAFLTEARALLEQSEKAIRTAQQAEQKQLQPFNVGYVWGLFHSQVPPVLDKLRFRFPQRPMNLLDMTPAQQARDLLDRRLDAGFIGFAQDADSMGLMKRKVADCRFVAVLKKDHPAAHKSKLTLSMLAEDFFFTISDQSYPGASRFIADACEQAGFRPKILQAAERGYTIVGLVASNRGVAILPESLKAMPHPGVVFRPLLDFPQTDLFLAWRKEDPSPVLRGLIEMFP
jgi:DNA-binding transcriptional LysR family regulator